MNDVASPSEINPSLEVKNWADNAGVVARLRSELYPMLDHVRSRRKPLQLMWQQLFKVWSLEHESQGYLGRSNIYVPAGKKAGETLLAQLVSGTFPSDDFFNVTSCDPNMDEEALKVKTLLKYQIDKQARLRMFAEPFYRSLIISGNSPVKIHWVRKAVNTATRRSRKLKGLPVQSEIVLYNGPAFQPLDISSVFWYPETEINPRNCELVFQDMTVPLSSLQQKARAKLYNADAVARAGKGNNASGRDNELQAKLSAQGITSPTDRSSAADGGSAYDQVTITEVYTLFDPTAGSRAEEGNPVPFLITFSESGEVLRAIQNPWWYQEPPFLLGRMGVVNDRLYGTGLFESIRQLNVLLNDQVNQGMDGITYALNPVTLTNPNNILGALQEIEPGAQWLVQDINNSVKWMTPPMEILQGTSLAATQTMSWLQDFAGAPPVLQGGSSPGRAFKTATGIGTAQQNATVPLEEVVRACEVEVWEQVLQRFHQLNEQFLDAGTAIKIAGQDIMRMGPQDIAGDWNFEWTASSQTNNAQVKGSQIQQALQTLSQPAVVQSLQQNGIRINLAPLIRRLYNEVFGFRDVSDVLVQQTMGAMGMQVPQNTATPDLSSGQPPGPDASMNGATPELAGNGEFAATRLNANAIAGAAGGST